MANVDINKINTDINTNKSKACLKVTFVCTGNTCRSPMAEYMMRAELKAQGLQDRVKVMSCGIMADTSSQLSPLSYQTLRTRGVRACKTRQAKQFRTGAHGRGIVVAMTEGHKAILRSMGVVSALSARDIIGKDIADPYGGRAEDYAKAADDIQALTKAVISRLKTIL